MKKFLVFGMMSAMALTFVACSSDDELANVNPTFDGENVKSAITLNIGSGATATRMSADVTQQDGATFKGMNNMYLFPATVSEFADASALKTSIALDPLTASEISTDQSSKIYTNKSVPVGTKGFLFYGRSTATTTGTTTTLASSSATPSAITFAPVAAGTMASTDAVVEKLNAIITAFGTPTGALKDVFDAFTNTAVRAGSTNALKEMIADLKASVTATPDGELKTAVLTAITAAETEINSSNIPGDGLPEGAAQLQYSSDKFAYVTAPTLGASNVITVKDIVKPADLWYFTSTPLKAKAEDITWPKTVETWSNEAWAGATDIVNATTRNIALVNNINYGVALLETTVRVADGVSEFTDNAKSVLGGETEDQKIAYPAGGFPLTGVLVGGQPSEVKWNFLGSDFVKTVYDAETNSAKAENSKVSDKVYTLLYDNYEATAKDVIVALEFTNTAEAFYGVNGIIKKGMKFYLVGKLDKPTTDLTFADGKFFYPTKGQRVFAQDFKTIANFTISATSLKNAYVTIPDLRASQMALGLSVDLKWQAGYIYNVIFD